MASKMYRSLSLVRDILVTDMDVCSEDIAKAIGCGEVAAQSALFSIYPSLALIMESIDDTLRTMRLNGEGE
jgi:hypothetical protein